VTFVQPSLKFAQISPRYTRRDSMSLAILTPHVGQNIAKIWRTIFTGTFMFRGWIGYNVLTHACSLPYGTACVADFVGGDLVQRRLRPVRSDGFHQL